MKYSLNSDKMFLDSTEGNTIVINFSTGVYYGFSSLASAVVEKIACGTDTEAILSSVKKREDCPQDIDSSFAGLLASLVSKEIFVEEKEAGSTSGAEFGPEAFVDGYSLDIQEYAEVQDLIMADPVHDVDPEKGWPELK